ncbi:hypothetical protein [Lysobacter sp. CA199]|uniref:hypothetical protein n=1 Tax=Lysobacter sp. CA199 TaxID=3455608 RepID=UPI003F8D66C7
MAVTAEPAAIRASARTRALNCGGANDGRNAFSAAQSLRDDASAPWGLFALGVLRMPPDERRPAAPPRWSAGCAGRTERGIGLGAPVTFTVIASSRCTGSDLRRVRVIRADRFHAGPSRFSPSVLSPVRPALFAVALYRLTSLLPSHAQQQRPAVAPSPESVVYFRQLWDNAILFAYRGCGPFAQSVCDVYRSQVRPDPSANEVVPLLHRQCRVSVVNIVVHHTNPLPFPL